MKRIVSVFLALVALSSTVSSAAPSSAAGSADATNEEVAARKVALDVAGAFSNAGFKTRDGTFSGLIHPKENLFVQVNLYAGNQYWFSAGATDKAKKLAIAVFDETGKPLEIEPYDDISKAAAGFAPEASGPYYVRIQELEGEPANFCLIYSYK
jgi:hypothetical protein